MTANLRLRVLPRYPSNITATDGFEVVRVDADLVVQPAYENLGIVASVPDANETFFQAWTRSTDAYNIIPFQALVDNIGDVIIGDNLSSIGSLSTDSDLAIYFTGPGEAATYNVSSFFRTLSASEDEADVIDSLGLGTAALSDATDFATSTQGAKADTALQPAAIGTTVQAYSSTLDDIADGTIPVLDSKAQQDLRLGTFTNGLRPVPERWRYPRLIADTPNYKMAPFSAMIGEVMIGLFSDGGIHGDTDRQIFLRKDGLRGTWQSVTYYEVATATYDFSLLSPLMAEGDVLTLKAFTNVKMPDGVKVTINSTITNWTNSLLYSDDHENAAWTKTGFDAFGAGSVANTTAVRAPDGSQTADFIRPTTGTSTRSLQQTLTGFSPNQSVCATVWFRRQTGGAQWVRVFVMDAGATGNYIDAFIDIQNGVLGTVGQVGNASGAAASIIQGGDGWYGLVLTGVPNTSGTNTILIIRPVNNGTSSNTYTADGVNGFYIWRGAVIASATLPSQILLKTTSAAVATGVPSGETYAYWSRVKLLNGSYYRTGYTTTPTDWKSALFKSPDNGYSWKYHAVLGSGAGLDFNEADVALLDNGDFITLIREDAGAGRPMYFNRSIGGDNSWGTATFCTTFEGTQPNVNKANDGRLVIAAGDRTGVSGLNFDGSVNYQATSRVGAAIAIAPAAITTQSQIKTVGSLGLSYGTDCGQPMGEVEADGSITYIQYLTKDGAVSPAMPNIYGCNAIPSELS